MNELERKEIEEIKQIFADNGFEDSNGGEEIDILVHDVINKGYGKVEDYKKEIFALKTTLEDREHEVRELNKKVEKLNEQNKALLQGQIDCANESQKEIARLKYENKTLLNALKEAESIAKDFINEDNQLKIANEIADMIKEERQQAVKEVLEKLKKRYKLHPLAANFIALFELNDLAKEYKIDLE